MRRAILAVAVLIGVALCFATRDARTATNDLINGVGLVDYSRKPDFRIGSWVRYRVQGSSNLGTSDDYVVTVLIAGEEHFWGEDGFWVETWTETKSGTARAVATLMSYAIFADSLPLGRLQYYMRKTISGVGEGGEPLQELVKRPPGSLRVRARLGENTRYDVVPLPADTAIVPRGEYLCERTMFKQGVGTTQETGDSTVYTENRENRTVFTNLDVPITHIAKEDIERLYHRRAWQRGRSGEGAPIALVEQALGAARLIEYGEGEKPRLTPLAYQKPVRTAASAAVRKPAGTPKTR